MAALERPVSSLFASPAFAQAVGPQKAVAAQALYEQATAEMDAKNYASACRKLEEVTKLVPEGLGAKLTLGECYEGLGKLASAWTQYSFVESMAPRMGQPERAQKAAERASALKPKLAMLTIQVPQEVRSISGLTITRDGVPVGEGQWDAEVPVDVGPHEVIVTAPGYKISKRTAEVLADGARATLKLKPLEPDTASKVGAPGAPGAPVVVAPAPDRTWQKPVSLAAMAAGTVGLIAGGVLGGAPNPGAKPLSGPNSKWYPMASG